MRTFAACVEDSNASADAPYRGPVDDEAWTLRSPRRGPILLAYGWRVKRGGRRLRRSRFARWLNRLAGGFLAGAGVELGLADAMQERGRLES